VTRWPRRLPPPRIEPPEWVRVFHREAWSEPDEWERQMAGDRGLPEEFRRWHAERRWVEARNDWYRQHPEADHRLEDLLARRERRRAGAGVEPEPAE
jgi:hypothetical protein